METILALETSVSRATISLWREGAVLFDADFTTDRKHNSMVFHPLEEALERLDGEKLSVVLAGVGPGSYSGTRVGIAVAQGVAITHGCPAVGISSLAATSVARETHPAPQKKTSPLSQPEPQPEQAPSVIAIGDARRGLFYFSKISSAGEASVPELMDATCFQQRLREANGVPLLTVDDPALLGLSDDLACRVTRCQPEARWLLDIWLGLDQSERELFIARPLAPAYLRPPFTSKAKGGHPLLRKAT